MSSIESVNFKEFVEQVFANRKSTCKARLCYEDHHFVHYSTSKTFYNHQRGCLGDHFVWSRNKTALVEAELVSKSYVQDGVMLLKRPRADRGGHHLWHPLPVLPDVEPTTSSQDNSPAAPPQPVNPTSFPEDSGSPAQLSSFEDFPSSASPELSASSLLASPQLSASPACISCQPFSLDLPDRELVEESKSQAGEPDGPFIPPYEDLFPFPFDDKEETEGQGEKLGDESDDEDSMVLGSLREGFGKLRGGPYSADEGN